MTSFAFCAYFVNTFAHFSFHIFTAIPLYIHFPVQLFMKFQTASSWHVCVLTFNTQNNHGTCKALSGCIKSLNQQSAMPRWVSRVSAAPDMSSTSLFFQSGFDIMISYEREKLMPLLCENTANKCLFEYVWMWRRVSITSSKISPKQTYRVSSVRLCHLLITHSLSVFVTLILTQTRQVELPDNQNQAWTCGRDVGARVEK